jgi:ATP-binding cassette, subfamily G (WHITE), member 2
MDVDNDLHLKFTRPHFDLNVGADKPKLTQRQTTSWFKQFSVILERTLKEQTRKKTELTTQLIQTVIMAFLIGLAFLNIGNTQKSIVKRGPVLFFCAVNMGMFGALTTINSFPGERMLALRERASGTYLASAYFFASTLYVIVYSFLITV